MKKMMKTQRNTVMSLILFGILQFCIYNVAICEAQSAFVCPDDRVLAMDDCFLRNKMYRITSNECRETCAFLPYVAELFGWKCGTCDSPPIGSPTTAVAPVPSPIRAPSILSPVRPPTTTTGIKKCGGAVNTGGGSANATCLSDLWNPTQDRNMHCYAYGGVTDPCALHNNNDVNDGLLKSPSSCDRDTFYLWDEVRIKF